jgi:hypothetical protein
METELIPMKTITGGQSFNTYRFEIGIRANPLQIEKRSTCPFDGSDILLLFHQENV